MAKQAQRLRQRLERSRGFSARLLEDFSTAEDWTRQLHEGGNHAVWFVGHMGTTDNFMISILDPEQAEGWAMRHLQGHSRQPMAQGSQRGRRVRGQCFFRD